MPRIVIAEDDDAMREFLSQALMREGYEVTAVANGADALCALQDEGQYDLLLAEVKMPGVDGVSLARCVRRDKPGLPIVFVTGYVGEVLQEVRDNSRYDEVLPKPFQLNELVEVVDRALSH